MKRLASALSGVTIACALALTGCSTQVSSEPASSETLPADAKHPVSGLDVVVLKVSSGEKTHGFQVELAKTRFEQARGLMFRTELGPDEGMLFPMDPPRRASFWMRNTVIGLDIIYIGADRRILNIAANAVPYDETPLLSEGEAAAVLEIPGGRAAELGIKAGDKVDW